MNTGNLKEQDVMQLVTRALHVALPGLSIESCAPLVNAAMDIHKQGDPSGLRGLLALLNAALQRDFLLRAHLARHQPSLQSPEVQRDIRCVVEHVLLDQWGYYGVHTTLIARPEHPRHPAQVATSAGSGDVSSLARVVQWVLIILQVADLYKGLTTGEREVLNAALRIESALLAPSADANAQVH